MRKIRRLLLVICRALVLFTAGFLLWIYLSQDGMIFHPEPYNHTELRTTPERAAKLKYVTSGGSQTSWYVPPRSQADHLAVPGTLWILFHGNASLALHWSEHVKVASDENAGYLLFEYPGYGLSEGAPSRKSISEATDAAIAALADYLGTTTAILLDRKVRVLGYSLGAAVALEFAAQHPADRIVVVAPFTTMRAMADRTVSPYISWMLSHRFDNLASLETIARRTPRPEVILIHGTADPVVPIEMSREMKGRWPELVELVEVPGGDHETVLDGIERYLGEQLP